METLCEKHLQNVKNGVYSEKEMTEMECQGKSPWGNDNVPQGVWAWSEQDDQVIIGFWFLRIASYTEAIEKLKNAFPFLREGESVTIKVSYDDEYKP